MMMTLRELLWTVALLTDMAIFSVCTALLIHSGLILFRRRRDRRPATPVDLGWKAHVVFTRKKSVTP
jgi:hypothetical protein